MNIAFYYHIPIVLSNNTIKVPGYLGVFIDALAADVDLLYLVMHQARPFEELEAEYEIKAKNIKFIDLGFKTAAWHRSLFHKKLLRNPLKQLQHCDVFLVRSPSPLAPYFHHYLTNTKLVYLVVGDYGESVKQSKARTLREWIVNKYVQHNDYVFRKRIQQTDIVVNSPALFDKYEKQSKSIYQIRTTTLHESDFFQRNDTCQQTTIQLLYTGRIDLLKGLAELVEALALIKLSQPNLKLNLVGWEAESGNPIETQLKQLATKKGVLSQIHFHGKKQIGAELNSFYRSNDIYVIPSYEEGFPRTIWEAMANSLPVVATTVGAIPKYLKHKHDAYLIPSKSSQAIAHAIEEIIRDQKLRQTLIENGMVQAKQTTLSIQTKKLINHLQLLIHS